MAPTPLRPATTAAALLLAVFAILLHTNPSPAQETSPPAAIPAPELTAQPADRAISLTWTPITGAARYELWTWNSADDWQLLGDNLTGTTFHHTGLTAGNTYFYQICAVTAAGQVSDWSEQVAASLPSDLAAPALTASASTGAVDLRWDAVPGAARYQLWTWWHDDTGWQQLGGHNLTGTTYSHAGLTAGVTYYYQMCAVDELGVDGPWSEPVSATLDAAPAPASSPTPTQTTTPATTPSPTPTPSPTQENLAAHTATPTPTQTSSLPAPSSTTTQTPATTPPPTPTPSPTQEDLAAHTATPTPTQTSSPPAASSTAAPAPTGPATATSTPAATSAATELPAPSLAAFPTQSAVELSWNPIPAAVRYELWYWTSAAGWQRLDNEDLTAARFTHSNLAVGITYYYSVRVLNAAGDAGPWSDHVPAALTADSTQSPSPTPTPSPAPTSTPSLTPTPMSTPAASAFVSAPPDSLGVHSYYRKYLDAGGVPVLSSNEVTDEELYQTRDTILAMLSDRPDILATMAEFNFRVLIYPDRFEKGGRLDELPEFTGLDVASRAEGLAGETPYGWVSGSPEVARHCNHTLIHEFAHQIEDALRLRTGGQQFMSRLNSAYQAAMLRGLWQDRYASTNALEYWAEIVRAWLTPSQFAGWLGPGYQKLEDYDPVGAALVADVLGSPTPLAFCEIRRFDLRGTVNLPGSQPSQSDTHVLLLSMRSPVGGKRLLGASATASRSDATFAFERLIVENLFLEAAGGKPHIVLGIYRYNNKGNAACPVAAFIGTDGNFTRSTDPDQWKKLEVTGSNIAGLSFTIPPEFDWTPVHKCI